MPVIRHRKSSHRQQSSLWLTTGVSDSCYNKSYTYRGIYPVETSKFGIFGRTRQNQYDKKKIIARIAPMVCPI